MELCTFQRASVYSSLAPLFGVSQAAFDAQFPPTTSLPQGSYRTDTTLYTVGLRHEVLEGLNWRVSRSLGFQPPFITQINPWRGPARPHAGAADEQELRQLNRACGPGYGADNPCA